MKLIKSTGYSKATAAAVLENGNPINYLGPDLEPKYKWENNRPTSEIESYSTWFIQEGLPPFEVKFPNKVKLPEFLSIVEFDNIQATEYKNNVYFKADGFKEVK